MARPSNPKVKPEPATANTAGLAAGPTVGRTAEPSPAAGTAGAAPGRVSPVQMADLARLAGVSVSTVSRALSNSPLVNATVGGDNRLGGRLATAHLLASAAQRVLFMGHPDLPEIGQCQPIAAHHAGAARKLAGPRRLTAPGR